jgi:maltose O-acetyltransferase
MTVGESRNAVEAGSGRPAGLRGAGRLLRVLRNDLEGLHVRLRIANAILFFCPHFALNRLRTAIYRRCGIRIGARALILGTMDLSGAGRIWQRLRIGADCQITTPLYADLNANITIGNNVAVAHHAVLVTTNHRMGSAQRRSGPWNCAPIAIGDGCWIGACVTILPGVTIGRGSVIAAGAVVTEDVPPNTLAGGVPARVIRALSEEEE